MHYYQHHIGDFIRDTSRLSDSQTMAYLRLMWLYYESEKPLPNKPQVLAMKIGSTDDAVLLILEAFFTLENDEWMHTRCESEIAGYKAICNRNATNGKAGGRPKKTQPVPNGNPEVTQTEPHRNPNQEPITNNHKPITKEEKKETRDKPARFDPLDLELPECINTSAWSDWIAYRRSRKLTCAEPTMKAQIGNLQAWWNNGHDTGEIIKASISNGWQGLFEPKQQAAGQNKVDLHKLNWELAHSLEIEDNHGEGQE